MNFQGQRLDRPNEKAEAFNQHFATKGPKLASSIERKSDDNPLNYLERINEDFKQVDAGYIKKAVMGLKNLKSPGPDKIPTKLLKDAIEHIIVTLSLF